MHLYEIETSGAMIKVEARNREQARRIAERMGFIVRSVNLIG